MNWSRFLAAPCAAAALFASGPAHAADAKPVSNDAPGLAERLDVVEVKQSDAVVLGDIPGSFRIPGTDVSLRIYGFAELNYIHDFKGDNADIDIATFAPYVPLRGSAEAARTHRDILTARTSRFGVEAATPTRFGALGAKVEGDFVNEPRTGNTAQYGTPGNVFTQQQTSSYGFRLRHAYGSFAGLLAGQTWSTFMDVDNSPETVDFNGPIGSTFIRQPLVRYTYGTTSFGASRFTVGLENSSTYVIDPAAQIVLADSLSRMPDAVARWDASFQWGNVSVRAMTQELRVKGTLEDGTTPVSATKRGWGAGATTLVKARGGKDFLSVAVTGGDGIGRYLNYIEGAVLDPATGEIELERAIGVVAGYQLKTSDSLRFNFVYGITRSYSGDYQDVIRANGMDTGASAGKFAINRMVQQAHAGFFYTPIKSVDLGAEGIWGLRETLAGEHGDLVRVNLLARYYIN
jgi:hypothetical protein